MTMIIILINSVTRTQNCSKICNYESIARTRPDDSIASIDFAPFLSVRTKNIDRSIAVSNQSGSGKPSAT